MDELEDLLQKSNFEWSDAEKQQAAEDLNEIQGKTKKLISKANTTARSLRLLADKLDVVWKDCKTAHAYGNGASLVGGLLTLGGGIATVLTFGAATPLLVLGAAVGGAGAVTSLVAPRIEASINLKEVERAQKDLRETIEYVNIVSDTIQKWQDAKEVTRLLCIFCLALHTLKKTDPAIKILQKVILSSEKISIHFMTKLNAMGTAGIKLVRQVFTGVTDDVASAALKTGGQVTDDVVGAGVNVGANASKTAGKFIIGFSVLFLVWDAIELRSTIQELIEKRGSEAAKELREIAYRLDKECSFD